MDQFVQADVCRVCAPAALQRNLTLLLHPENTKNALSLLLHLDVMSRQMFSK